MVYCPVYNKQVRGWGAKAKVCRGCEIRNRVTGQPEPTLALIAPHTTWCRKNLTAPQSDMVLGAEVVAYVMKERPPERGRRA